MLGLMHVAAIYSRASGTWSDSGTTWKCRLQPVSPTTKVAAEEYVHSTHLAIGEASPVIEVGQQLIINLVTYHVVGVQDQQKPGMGAHHQEVWLTKAE